MPSDLLSHKSCFVDVPHNAEFHTLGFNLVNPLPGTLTFAGTAEFLKLAALASNVSAIITTPELLAHPEAQAALAAGKGLASSPGPRRTFFALHNELYRRDFYQRRKGFAIGAQSRISKHARISEEGVTIGQRVVIEDGVVIKPNVNIGDDCVIRAGTVIGGKGFQYLRGTEGHLIPIAHAGGVRIGDYVEIHALCGVDRHIFDTDTVIGNGTKLDNLVQFGHASSIGERCLLASSVVICGSVRIGNDVWIGPNATVSDSLEVGDGAHIGIGSVVTAPVPARTTIAARPAMVLGRRT